MLDIEMLEVGVLRPGRVATTVYLAGRAPITAQRQDPSAPIRAQRQHTLSRSAPLVMFMNMVHVLLRFRFIVNVVVLD